MFAELRRSINNIVCFGTVSQTKSTDGKALVRIKVMKRETDFLPVISFSNSFKKHFIPVRVGEQVVMFSPFGEANGGFILRSIFNKNAKEPALANEHTEVMEYEDGTVISYDTKAKELKINASDKITIICKAATVTADTVNVTATTVDVAADSVTVDSSAIDLGVGGTGVVTGECICAFTGAPHGDISSTVKAVK
jgi:phage baseplate assembly protein V